MESNGTKEFSRNGIIQGMPRRKPIGISRNGSLVGRCGEGGMWGGGGCKIHVEGKGKGAKVGKVMSQGIHTMLPQVGAVWGCHAMKAHTGILPAKGEGQKKTHIQAWSGTGSDPTVRWWCGIKGTV